MNSHLVTSLPLREDYIQPINADTSTRSPDRTVVTTSHGSGVGVSEDAVGASQEAWTYSTIQMKIILPFTQLLDRLPEVEEALAKFRNLDAYGRQHMGNEQPHTVRVLSERC